MGVDGLEEAEGDPDVDGEDVEVLGDVAVEEGTADGARAEDEDLERVGVLCCETEGGGVLVVDLVDVLVERTEMEGLVGEVVEEVLEDEEEEDLCGHFFQRREGDLPCRETEEFCKRVEKVNLNGKLETLL